MSCNQHTLFDCLTPLNTCYKACYKVKIFRTRTHRKDCFVYFKWKMLWNVLKVIHTPQRTEKIVCFLKVATTRSKLGLARTFHTLQETHEQNSWETLIGPSHCSTHPVLIIVVIWQKQQYSDSKEAMAGDGSFWVEGGGERHVWGIFVTIHDWQGDGKKSERRWHVLPLNTTSVKQGEYSVTQ